jgi:beta-aspartyl-peptidase (threonine type)
MVTRPLLVVHGGAWNIPDDMVAAHERGVRAAAERGWEVLGQGGSALDAVEESVAGLEDDDTFDAGRGSFLTSAGTVQMDALIMDGATLRAGGAGGVERVRNAVRLSRLILDKSPHVYFVGEGAERFAAGQGMELIDNRELVIPREVERLREYTARLAAGQAEDTFAGPQDSHDTVGAVAVDGKGNIAAATSTGGTLNKTPGRVGDSSLIGCGCYADNQSAAVSCTGWGEPIMKLVLAKWAADRVQAGHDPQAAANSAIQLLRRRLSGHGGLIVVDALGRHGIAHNTPRMAWGVAARDGVKTGIRR